MISLDEVKNETSCLWRCWRPISHLFLKDDRPTHGYYMALGLEMGSHSSDTIDRGFEDAECGNESFSTNTQIGVDASAPHASKKRSQKTKVRISMARTRRWYESEYET